MSDAIIVAFITGVCAVIGQLLIAKSNNKDIFAKMDEESKLSDQKLDAKLEKYQAVTDEKITELTREVRAHNGHAERIALLEAEDKRLNERIKVIESKTA